jgi:hypothetical protein
MFFPPTPLTRQPTFWILAITVFLTFLSHDAPASAQSPADGPNPLLTQPQDRITRTWMTKIASPCVATVIRWHLRSYDAGIVSPRYRMERRDCIGSQRNREATNTTHDHSSTHH